MIHYRSENCEHMHRTIEAAVECRGSDLCGIIAVVKGRTQELTNQELLYAERYALELADRQLSPEQLAVLASLGQS